LHHPRYSKFGLAFQDAASTSNAGTKHDRFDTSIVEVRKEDLSGFVEALSTFSTERMG
jgi:cell division control protein 45